MPKNVSFEFFPPRTDEARAKLRDTYRKLAAVSPQYFSVTYGAGGSTAEFTQDTVLEIVRVTGIDAAPHLSCVGATRRGIQAVLDEYQARGIKRIVALRGDLPSGTQSAGEFRYAMDLVAYIRAATGDHFHLEVACYPEVHPRSAGWEADLKAFQCKVDAGADGAITQYFYNADAYFFFIDAAYKRGVTVPIVPGIMPITNYSQLARFSEGCGAEIPRWLRRRLEACGDDREAIREVGEDAVTSLCQTLLAGGAPGLHFYTMNQAEPTLAILRNLG